jgi:hypothetical protein
MEYKIQESKKKVETFENKIPKKIIKIIDNEKKAKLVKIQKKMVYLYWMKECFFCKEMRKAWEEAKEYKYKKNIHITEIERSFVNMLNTGDVKGNNLSDINAFPFIVAFNEKNERIEYRKPRTKENFIKFIKLHG